MSMLGQDVIDVGSKHLGDKYVLGARVPLDNPTWRGPWDCAEFTSWCAYQSYGLIFGAGKVSKVSQADPYSGYWYSEAKQKATVISWKDALSIPGAVLIRAPAQGPIGHVAFAIGDGESTLEARGAAFGVGIFKKADTRPWSIGCLLPGVEYGKVSARPAKPTPAPWAGGLLWLRRPPFKGPEIVALQRALARHRIDPGPIDGEFGPMTHAAIVTFQAANGLEVDGVVGRQTLNALGLDYPIVATEDDVRIYAEARTPKGPAKVALPPPVDFDGIVGISQSGRTFTAKTKAGETFIVGSVTSYSDDMHRLGLFQGTMAIRDSLRFGTYKASDFPALGPWGHFIEPTLCAEGGGRFATLNTYDRAAFTFGAPQLAAHTPGENFIEYFRKLIELPDATQHFPELSLLKNAAGKKTLHLKKGSTFEDLEEVVLVTRPNGKKENQLARLMAYLNPSATKVDDRELSVAARLMNWLRLDPKAKELQIEVFVNRMQAKLKTAKTKVNGFDGKDWRTALWVMDILHQGRGTYAEMARAISSPSPEASLKKIGWPTYKERIGTVESGVRKLATSGVLDGFKV
ncbi:peptidoglycan-binding protein [Xanthobacter sp. KR7-65]|uniref:C40 family peptidase n=1 Tax=Xanthobacter sp. KR7-65 TaxID=3156612 RepID=UPI0032B4D381